MIYAIEIITISSNREFDDNVTEGNFSIAPCNENISKSMVQCLKININSHLQFSSNQCFINRSIFIVVGWSPKTLYGSNGKFFFYEAYVCDYGELGFSRIKKILH